MKDETMPKDKWEFDQEVTDVFDDMLTRSIPQYELMRSTVFDLGCRYVQHQTDVVDLGCSHGEALAPFVRKYGATLRYVGVECSVPMLEAFRKRFEGMIKAGIVEAFNYDLRTQYPLLRASLTLSILTLQFVPIEHRQRVVRDVYKNTRPGGALIVVEKVLGDTAEIDTAMVAEYHEMKRRNGYTEDQIARKKLSLEGVLVPVTAKWNEQLLRGAGFQQVDCVWRWLNFAAWIAVKEG